MALDAQILLSILAHESSSGDISRTLRVTPASYSVVLSDGTGANQAQVAWGDSATQINNVIRDIDLTAIADDRGTVSFAAIKVLYIRNNGTKVVTVGTGVGNLKPSDPWNHCPLQGDGSGYTIPQGGVLLLSAPGEAGFPVEASSKVLRIYSDPGEEVASISYDIAIIGEGTIT